MRLSSLTGNDQKCISIEIRLMKKLIPLKQSQPSKAGLDIFFAYYD